MLNTSVVMSLTYEVELADDNVDDSGWDVVLCVTDSVVVSGVVTPSVVRI